MKKHNLPIRVYYEDTDVGGVVYYANYLKFAERGRSEFLREIGYENRTLIEQEKKMFVVTALEAHYLSPARLDDLLTLETVTEDVKNASFSMKQTVFCGNNKLFHMTVRLACVELQGKPVKLPEGLRKALEEGAGGKET